MLLNKVCLNKNFGRTLVLTVLLINTSFSVSADKDQDSDSIYKMAISNPERPLADLAMDEIRKPADILPFSQVAPGDIIYEIGAGGGYTTELMARVVGDSGKVLVHRLFNSKRIENNRLPNVIQLRDHSLFELADVLAENKIDKNQLDAVIVFFILHDTYLNSEMDQSILSTIYSYLKPGGFLVVLDNAADHDSGLSSTKELHRIGENFVIKDIEKAGFVVDATTDVLRNNKDDHTRPWGEFKGLQDRFAIRFKKHK